MINTARPRCRDCAYYNGTAWREEEESRCKRLDHKNLQFRVPFFVSYDCNGQICADFKPSPMYKYFYSHWHDWYIKFYTPKPGKTIALRVKGEGETDFNILYSDFFNNTFLNDNGSLKWLYKEYYIKTKHSPTGYLLIKEFPDGTFGRGGKVYKSQNELIDEQKEIHINSMLSFAFTNLLIAALRNSKCHGKSLAELNSDCLPHVLDYIKQKYNTVHQKLLEEACK